MLKGVHKASPDPIPTEVQRRQQLSKEEYRRKCRLRPAIEGTISQFKRRLDNGKMRIRAFEKVRNSSLWHKEVTI